ncbi:HpcH/HpaI aldolase/citrate lyase family protein [Rhodococcus sp. WAY2]|uniref:HpcH/HpaI aldolase/citrate lyase family protein n=1 Tax=Rhodococcus sp. WAY2 TaxID=2663121 RepID=UPI00131FE6D7|nr:CoA ester lyase [Rhodococcus sp. WAY2]QHE70829.1 L-malyl-CoA/beta-methylmalyl-CoA lyase [Rhodococcus sp. WAY2]
MTDAARPRRSALYVPGNNSRALEKAAGLLADVVILDLEDAVGDDAKPAARERVCDIVRSGVLRPREVVIRVNGLGTEWHEDDMAAVAQSGADGVLVPKVGSGDDVRALVGELEAAGADNQTTLWLMIETPGSFLHAEEIAAASDRVSVLVIGTNDLINDLHALQRPGRAPVMTALSLAVLGARSAGRVILDGVFNDIGDGDGFIAEARQGREMGFDGKTVVHPSQIGPANSAFGPSPEEVEYARTVVSAYENARAAGDSVITVDERMIESLHVRDAQRILTLAARIDELTDLDLART